MDFGTAVKTCLIKYANFSGRASRSEYWYFALFYLIVDLVAIVIDAAVSGMHGFSPVSLIVSIALFLPSMAVLFRRLHDTDRSGWWSLIGLVPLVGGVVLIVFLCQRGTGAPNRFA
jgi:uncharacterized membrane protein YhaH (DUF805 family)